MAKRGVYLHVLEQVICSFRKALSDSDVDEVTARAELCALDVHVAKLLMCLRVMQENGAGLGCGSRLRSTSLQFS